MKRLFRRNFILDVSKGLRMASRFLPGSCSHSFDLVDLSEAFAIAADPSYCIDSQYADVL